MPNYFFFTSTNLCNLVQFKCHPQDSLKPFFWDFVEHSHLLFYHSRVWYLCGHIEAAMHLVGPHPLCFSWHFWSILRKNWPSQLSWRSRLSITANIWDIRKHCWTRSQLRNGRSDAVRFVGLMLFQMRGSCLKDSGGEGYYVFLYILTLEEP